MSCSWLDDLVGSNLFLCLGESTLQGSTLSTSWQLSESFNNNIVLSSFRTTRRNFNAIKNLSLMISFWTWHFSIVVGTIAWENIRWAACFVGSSRPSNNPRCRGPPPVLRGWVNLPPPLDQNLPLWQCLHFHQAFWPKEGSSKIGKLTKNVATREC